VDGLVEHARRVAQGCGIEEVLAAAEGMRFDLARA
jgi:hypothetical protein